MSPYEVFSSRINILALIGRWHMKRIITAAVLMIMVMGLVSCGKKDNVSEADTVGGKYINMFNVSSGKTCDEVADELLAGSDEEMNLVMIEVEPGYLNGFDDEIKGFDEGVMFSPMIGSIPFVGYVFKTSDPASLEALLKSKANLRWNICTEADEMVSATKGDLVFFMMCTNEN